MLAPSTNYSSEHHKASVSLIFSEEQTAWLRQLSENLNTQFGEFIPHITLVNVVEQDMQRLAAAAAALSPLDSIVCDGVSFLPDLAGDCVWVELRAQKTDWMNQARQLLLEGLSDIHPGLDVDSYRPHITLGCVQAGTLDDVDLTAIPHELPLIVNPRVAACYNGVHGKVVKVFEG